MSTSTREKSGPKKQEAETSRREATRQKLVAAARELMLNRDHFSLSIDEITKLAKLSRAVFYLHYPNKYAIVVDVVQEESTKLDSLYRWFESFPNPTLDQIRAFLMLLIRVNRRSRRQISLFYQATSYNPDVWKTFAENRERHGRLLGASLSAFRNTGRGEEIERERAAKARLLLYQMEQVSLYATFNPDHSDIDDETDALAEALQEFIERYRDDDIPPATAPDVG